MGFSISRIFGWGATAPAERRLGYDATAGDKRRRAPETKLRTEDGELDATDRRKLVATTRNLQRNFSIAAWMLRKHLDYVSTFEFQATTGNDAIDDQVERLMTWWDHKDHFDIAGRHSRRRFLRLAEARRTIDGDVGVMKLVSGHVQGIEGDRIRQPYYSPDGAIPVTDLTHGVQTNKAGRSVAYALHNRTGNWDGFVFDRMIPADHLLLHGYFDRFDQVRGISPLAPAVNTLSDTYEGFTYALAKAKVSQLFAMAFFRDADQSLGQVMAQTEEGEESAEGSEEDAAPAYDVNFGKGPFTLDLEAGDRAEILESKQPSTEFREFSYAMIAAALKALDIPFSFYNESFSTYSGSREALLIYDQSAEEKRQENRELLNALTRWRLQLWIIEGRLVLPAGMTVDDLSWDWIHRGLPWIDPLKETDADVAAVDAGFTSTIRVCKRMGTDAYALADEEAAYREYRRAKGLGTDSPARKSIEPLPTEAPQ